MADSNVSNRASSASFTTLTSWHTLPDGYKVHTQTWTPSPSSGTRAMILYIHGFSDHIGRVDSFMSNLASRGIQVTGFDQRGWGRSVTGKSDRGATGPTSTVMADITHLLTTHPSCLPQLRAYTGTLPPAFFLMGHSMGGAETLFWASDQTDSDPLAVDAKRFLTGYLALAPYLRLAPASQPSRALVLAGKIAMRVVPKMQMVQKLVPQNLCRDLTVGSDWEQDELCHNTGTLDGMNGMIDRGEALAVGQAVLLERKPEVGHGLAVYLTHGSGDLVTDCATTQRFFDTLAVKDKTLKIYDGWYHVLHAEPGEDKNVYMKNVGDWILSKAGSAVSEDTAGSDSKL